MKPMTSFIRQQAGQQRQRRRERQQQQQQQQQEQQQRQKQQDMRRTIFWTWKKTLTLRREDFDKKEKKVKKRKRWQSLKTVTWWSLISMRKGTKGREVVWVKKRVTKLRARVIKLRARVIKVLARVIKLRARVIKLRARVIKLRVRVFTFSARAQFPKTPFRICILPLLSRSLSLSRSHSYLLSPSRSIACSLARLPCVSTSLRDHQKKVSLYTSNRHLWSMIHI